MLKIAILLVLCAGIQSLFAQQNVTFAGEAAIRYEIAPNLIVYASACTYESEPAICYDVSYSRIASAKRGLLAMAGAFATNGEAGTVGNILDEDPHNGKLYITASKAAFVPTSDASYAWEVDRDQLIVKHQNQCGEELKDKSQNLHGFLNFQPFNGNGQLVWTNGSMAKVLIAKSPKDNAAGFLAYFYSSVNDFAAAYARIVN